MNRLGSIQKVNNNRSREDGEWGGQPVSQNRYSLDHLDENFTLTLQKVEKNMRNILQSINKVFNDRESKLANKIEALIKAEKKEMDDKNTEAEDLLENIGKF